jgi:membrane protein
MSDRASRVATARARAGTTVARVRSIRAVRLTIAFQTVFGDADGNLLAAGLAYNGLFAVISGLLLLVSILVLIGDSPQARDSAIDSLVAGIPPLEPFAHAIVDGLADGARVGTLVGLVAFTWGASGFYLALHGALDRVMPGERRRSSIVARIHGILAVALVVGAIVLAIVAGSILSFEGVTAAFGVLGLSALIGPLVGTAVSTVVVVLAFRFVPTDPPSVRQALPGSLIAGVGIGLLTSLFGLVGPLLVGSLSGLGVIASVFVALIWFSWTFRILLYGASIARVRRDEARAPLGPVLPSGIGDA